MLRDLNSLLWKRQAKLLFIIILIIFILSHYYDFIFRQVKNDRVHKLYDLTIPDDGDRRKCFEWIRSSYNTRLTRTLGPRPNVILMATVAHENFGDRFIWVGEELILERLGANVIYRCVTPRCNLSRIESYLTANNNTKICFHGGGNFGDIYRTEQRLKLLTIQRFNKTRIMLFPQSIYYRSSDVRDQEIETMKKHPDLHIMVRSKDSIDLLKKHFSSNKNHQLIVDIAMTIGSLPRFCEPQFDVIFFRRRDTEKALSLDYFNEIIMALIREKITFQTLDWLDYKKYINETKYKDELPKDNTISIHSLELSNFLASRAHVMITDRLHAGILGMLINQPVLMIENSYGKLRGVTDILKEQPACDTLRRHFPENVEEILKLVKMYLPAERTVGPPCEFEMRPIFPSLIDRLKGTPTQ